MTRTLAIARREITSYFYSPVAYVVLTLFLLVCGWLFRRDFAPGQPVAMRTIFEWMVWVLVVIVPLLCMGLLSQESASGTIESMMTAPVDEAEVVVGKFLGSIGFFLVLLSPSLIYLLMMRIFGRPDWGPIFSGFLGIILVGSLFTSIALFCSSLTRSQVVAAMTAAGILFVITIVPWWAGNTAALSPFWRAACDQSVFYRYTDFAKGVIDVSHLVFFVAFTAVFLFLTVKVLESRRWK